VKSASLDNVKDSSRSAPTSECDRQKPSQTDFGGKRAAILLFSDYPDDPRPYRSTAAMVDAGMEVDLYCVDEAGTKEPFEKIGNLSIYRIATKRDRSSKFAYLWQYSRFILSAFLFLARRSLRIRYDFVHVHTMPDMLVFSALIPKLRGARIILDLHDPMPELMMSIYDLSGNHLVVKLLRFLERRSIRFANVIVTPNITFRNLFISRGCPPEKIKILMNSPEPEVFCPARMTATTHSSSSFQLIHHGSIVHRHGIDLLVEAMALVRDKIPGLHLIYYGPETPFVETITKVARKNKIDDIVEYRGMAYQKEIAEAIHDSDLGIIPNRHSPFTSLNFPTRIFEYLAMNRPVIAPATTGIKDYFKDDELVMFKPDDIQDLAKKILWVYENRAAAAAFVERGRKVYLQNLWLDEKRRFLEYLAANTATA